MATLTGPLERAPPAPASTSPGTADLLLSTAARALLASPEMTAALPSPAGRWLDETVTHGLQLAEEPLPPDTEFCHF